MASRLSGSESAKAYVSPNSSASWLRRLVKSGLTVDFRACIDYTLWVMGKSCQVDTVLLTLELLCVFPFFAVVDLEGFVILRDQAELAGVIEVDGRDVVRTLAGARTKALGLPSINGMAWCGDLSGLCTA